MAKRVATSDAYRHFGAYERARQALLESPGDQRLERTLAYWVLPADRRLPVAFLDRTLGDILSCSLDELLATPGVGQKKIGGLMTLLRRALKSTSDNGDFELTESGDRRLKAKSAHGFDPSLVSEELWGHWRDTVRRCGVGDYMLGQLAPTLQALPTVIWRTPLDEYLDVSLDEMRSMKTHGEKRVHAILEVFGCVHDALASSMIQDHLDMRLTPKFVAPIANWIVETLEDAGAAPTAEDLHENVAAPLVKQIEVDLGKQISRLASARVSLSRNAPTVRAQAKRMDVTRARVYQLLDDCAKVVQVRWPHGRWLMAPLGSRLAISDDVPALSLYRAICDLFFPVEKSAREAIEAIASN